MTHSQRTQLTSAIQLIVATIGLATLAAACSEPATEPLVDDRGNWLKICSEGQSCERGSTCICGVCTTSCAVIEDCGKRPNAECILTSETKVDLLCHSDVPDLIASGICLPECDTEDDCYEGRSCVNLSCIAYSIPQTPACMPTAAWSGADIDLERELLERINGARKRGGIDCGIYGTFSSKPQLRLNSDLECAARLYAQRMNDESFFDVVDPAGHGALELITDMGYTPLASAVSLADNDDPNAIVASFLSEESTNCANISDEAFTEIGIGHSGELWTVFYAAPVE